MLFFARLREQIGKDQIILPAVGLRSVTDVWTRAVGTSLPANTLAAINHEHAGSGDPVKDGDEVAFFPPITGG